MARYLFVGILVLCFASPAFAAKRYYNRGASDQCKIVNIAPYYNKTSGGLVMAMQLKPCAQPATLEPFFTGNIG